ncbi:MAG: hypothetical protein WCF57_21105 [Pyrinomonadaceae bacterium]
MLIKQLASSLMITLLIFSTALAQLPSTQEAAQADQQAENRKQAEGRAVALLDEIIKESQRLTLAENRVHVQAIVADLLWKYDEARARALFKSVTSELTALLNNAGGPDEDEVAQSYRTSRLRTQLRQALLSGLARHDARLARDFLRATRRSESSASTPAYGGLEENQMELNLASQLAANDPKQATEVAEEALAKGLSYQLPQVVAALGLKDREAATKFANTIIARLRNENLSTNHEAASVALGLLRLGGDLNAANAQAASKSATPLVDEQVLRDVAELIASAALNDKSGRADALSVPYTMALIEKYAPSRAAQLRGRAAQSKKPEASSTLTEADDYKALIEKGSVDAILEAAQKAPPDARSRLYEQAATKALNQDDSARAIQIINQNFPEPYQRRQLLANIERQVLVKAVEKGKIDEARQLSAQARTNEDRVRILTELAVGLRSKGDKKVALELLDEARSLSAARAKNIKQLAAQFQVIRAYSLFDPARSLTLLESLMDQINELLNAALLLGGFLAEDEVVKDDEVLIQPIYFIIETSGVQFAPDLSALADADFDRTRSVADSFQRAEIRLAARLLIVQSVLEERRPPININVVSPMLGSEGAMID